MGSVVILYASQLLFVVIVLSFNGKLPGPVRSSPIRDGGSSAGGGRLGATRVWDHTGLNNWFWVPEISSSMLAISRFGKEGILPEIVESCR